MTVELVRCANDEVVAAFLSWFSRQPPETRLFLLEGLPGAGKSFLLEKLKEHGLPTIEVDKIITHPGDASITWLDRCLKDGALDAIEDALTKGPVIVDGPAVGPLTAPIADRLGHGAVRRIYLKLMSTSGGAVEWIAGFGLRDHAATVEPFWASIYGHHAGEPWRAADLIIERLDEEPS